MFNMKLTAYTCVYTELSRDAVNLQLHTHLTPSGHGLIRLYEEEEVEGKYDIIS